MRQLPAWGIESQQITLYHESYDEQSYIQDVDSWRQGSACDRQVLATSNHTADTKQPCYDHTNANS
jgi:glyceraldehyde-3-phosphate dehydrogenase/erythrose-4-phosphate dehydrogenase